MHGLQPKCQGGTNCFKDYFTSLNLAIKGFMPAGRVNMSESKGNSHSNFPSDAF